MFLRRLILLLSFLGFSSGLFAQAEVYPLRKIILGESAEQLAATPNDAGGAGFVYAPELPIFSKPEFIKSVAGFIGQPISLPLAKEIFAAISAVGRANDNIISASLPATQDVSAGVLRIIVKTSQYNEITFRGNRWFSGNLLASQLGIKPGDEIRLSVLEDAISWVNSNPFRSVKVFVDEIPNTPGKANLVIGVMEHRPYRVALSADDTGNELTGKYHFSTALQFGNLWGLDHQASYQFLSTDKWDVYQGHALEYRVPLPWRHFVALTTNYVRSQPLIGGQLLQVGKNIGADLRYTVPLANGSSPKELFFGLNFKQSNNRIEFPGVGGYAATVDVFQAFAGTSLVRRDNQGAWMLGSTLYASPGNINSRNTDSAWQAAPRSYASSRYVYGNISVQRLQRLQAGFELFTRAMVQHSSSNVVATEHLAIGGSNSVRGYLENIHAGENGWVLGNDLMSPRWQKKLSFLPQNTPPLEYRLLGFLDIADVDYKRRDTSNTELVFGVLASTGLGLRANIASNFSVNFDYGWELTHVAPRFGQTKSPPLANRGHLKVVLAF